MMFGRISTCVLSAAIAVVLTGVEGAYAGVISGKATFEFPGGQKPGRRPLQMTADPVCAAMHTEPVLSEVVLVDDDGGLQNVFVHLKEGVTETFEIPDEPVTLDQKGCIYTPRVLGVRAGQDLLLLNSDNTLHNVHPRPRVNDGFNLAMPRFMRQKAVSFAEPETMIPVRCDVHPWMAAFVGVMDHPFFAVSGEDGGFRLADVPDGTYIVEAWHERLGSQTQEVTVKDGEAVTLNFTFKLPQD